MKVGKLTKTDLLHIVLNTSPPYPYALRRLISHKDLSLDNALQLLNLTREPKEIQELLRFIWDMDKKEFFETIRCPGSFEIGELAWKFLENNLNSARRSVFAEGLIDIIQRSPENRQKAWKLFLRMRFGQENLSKIQGLHDGIELNAIKRQAAKKLKKKKNRPSKFAIAVVAKANKREA